MDNRRIRLDDLLLNYLGEFGFYQKFHYILVSIPALFAAMHALSWTFTAASMNFRCLYPGETEGALYELPDNAWLNHASSLTNHDGCRRIQNVTLGSTLPSSNQSSAIALETCVDGYAWDHSDYKLSVVDSFSLVCERDFIVASIQSLYFVGQFLGSIFFGLLSDKIGRKPVFLIAVFLQLLCDSLIAPVRSWVLVMMLRILVGFSHPGVFIMSCVIGAELVGPKYRNWSAVIPGILWAIGEMILGGLSYPLRDYRYLQLAISLPAIFLISYWWLLPESARWLMSKGRHAEVNNVLRRVASWNKKPPLPDDWYEKVDKEITTEISSWKAFLILFATPRLRIRTLINFVLWAVVTMGYYGLAFKPDLMGGDSRLAFILSGLFEIPGLIPILLINIVGRRLVSFIGFLLAALCLALTLAVPAEYAIANLLLVIIGKAALTGVFALVYIWTPEHYPTKIRNTATGACSMMGRLGGIAASFFSFQLAKTHPEAVALTFAVLAAVAGILSLFIPETAGEHLLETIEEAEELGRGQAIFITGKGNQERVIQRSKMNGNINIAVMNMEGLHDAL